MSILTRDAILDAKDIATETVAVPEWGGDVLVRGLSALERDNYEATLMKLKGNDPQWNFANARARLVARTVVDESGARLFSDEDVRLLAKKSAAAIQRVYDTATRLSGLSPQDMDELTKNSDDGQPEDSLTA
jgi:hypothetical protein